MASFNAAAAPTLSQMEGKWILVGAATDPDAPAHVQSNGYWPDGKIPSEKPGQAISVVMSFSSFQSAPRLLVYQETAVDIKSGKVLRKDDSLNVTQMNSGWQFQYQLRASDTCQPVVAECRIVTANGMLLCAQTIGNQNAYGNACEFQSSGPIYIQGFVHTL